MEHRGTDAFALPQNLLQLQPGAGRARGVRLGAPGAAAGARYGGGVGTAASLRGAERRRVGAPARGA